LGTGSLLAVVGYTTRDFANAKLPDEYILSYGGGLFANNETVIAVQHNSGDQQTQCNYCTIRTVTERF